MSHVVAQGFNTHIRRFVAGEPIAADTPLAPYDLADLIDRGFVSAPAVPVAANELVPPADAVDLSAPATKPSGRRGA